MYCTIVNKYLLWMGESVNKMTFKIFFIVFMSAMLPVSRHEDHETALCAELKAIWLVPSRHPLPSVLW